MRNLSAIASSIAMATCVAATVMLPAQAQNIAVVNGKAVPKARIDALVAQATRQGQPITPELEAQVRDEVVMREMFIQEAERRGLTASADFRTQMELARQAILIRELFSDYQKKNPVAPADLKAEYDKFKAMAGGGTEVRARHILVEKEEDAKQLTAKIKAGESFEELAKKNSKDPGSAVNGGDLDFASPASYVPEFGQALTKLKKGEVTEAPVKTQFGYHIIKLEDTRVAAFPAFEEVKPQIEQRLMQQKMTQFRDEVRSKARTDYKFSQ